MCVCVCGVHSPAKLNDGGTPGATVGRMVTTGREDVWLTTDGSDVGTTDEEGEVDIGGREAKSVEE